MSELIQSKKVKVFSSTTTGAVEFETTATNYGALQQDLQRAGLTVDKMNVVMRDASGARTALSFADTNLPEGDFVVLISPAMQKGAVDVKNASYNALRLAAKELGIVGLGSNPAKALLIKEITKKTKVKGTLRERKNVKETVANTVSNSINTVNAPVSERTAILAERFRALIESKFANKAEIKALQEATVVAANDIEQEANKAYAIKYALQVISDVLHVEAEEVVDAPKKSWVDSITEEDIANEMSR